MWSSSLMSGREDSITPYQRSLKSCWMACHPGNKVSPHSMKVKSQTLCFYTPKQHLRLQKPPKLIRSGKSKLAMLPPRTSQDHVFKVPSQCLHTNLLSKNRSCNSIRIQQRLCKGYSRHACMVVFLHPTFKPELIKYAL